MQARLIRRANELDGLAPAWWALWRKCPNSTPFQSPGWLLPWWQTFAPGELLSVAVISEDRLLALAALYIEAATARLLPLGTGISDYVDVLIDPDFQSRAGDALLRALSAHAGELLAVTTTLAVTGLLFAFLRYTNMLARVTLSVYD